MSISPGSLWMAVLTGLRSRKDHENGNIGTRTSLQPAQKPELNPAPPPMVTLQGIVVRSGEHFALLQASGNLYPLDSTGRAWPYEGEDVRVTGKLESETRTIHIVEIESAAESEVA